ncbi:hypothetical protein SERLA73DRAFT_157476 [Serpula lacrymans var. lacrymans S7.3]|uniref:Uncharacterized protein n=1 Tax=Serpula lacrymans var. lacrymans (strain S7.3) TaxID=936435 RepID=F8QJ80_SERL3|nr:hypothetical protein SERLA73DRAFT_157476 [Serpula lacrymans var. lacrymans S7.3]
MCKPCGQISVWLPVADNEVLFAGYNMSWIAMSIHETFFMYDTLLPLIAPCRHTYKTTISMIIESGKGKVVVGITRGVKDLQRKSIEEWCKRCRLDKSACTISRSKQTKKWRTSCNKCVLDNNTSLGSKSRNPVASEPEVPNHPIKIGLPRGAPKLVQEPHGTTGTQFTIRVPPPSQAVIPASVHHTPPPPARL